MFTPPPPSSLGSLSKDDGDGNENGKKAIGFDWQTGNKSTRARFFVPSFFAVTARLRRRLPNFAFLWRNWEHPWQRFSFCEFRYSPLEFNSWKKKKIASIWQILRVSVWSSPNDWQRLPFYGLVTPLLSDPGNEVGNAKGLEISVHIQDGEPHCFGR